MRYIPINKLEEEEDWPPQDWQERVHKAQEELRDAPDGKARAKIFEKYSDIWSSLKDDLKRLSHNKCWYCEVRTDGMRGDMDHHRPKGKVTENPDHPGYWWLAFEWRNFRYSCERCNSLSTDPATGIVGGKGNQFPLVGGEHSRIWQECDYEDLLEEDPLLLDPTAPDDPNLLSFNSDGRPAPATNNEKSVDYRRVWTSIKVYHLHHSEANRKRRKLYIRIRNLVDKFLSYQSIVDADRSNRAARDCIKMVMAELRELTAEDAEYSAAARTYLSMHRDKDYRIDRLLTA